MKKNNTAKNNSFTFRDVIKFPHKILEEPSPEANQPISVRVVQKSERKIIRITNMN